MRPSPKLPISSAPLAAPKPWGAGAMPHGALSAPREAKRRSRVPLGVVDVDETLAGPGDFVFGVGVLLGVGDDDPAGHGLDAERRVAGGEGRIGEGAGRFTGAKFASQTSTTPLWKSLA